MYARCRKSALLYEGQAKFILAWYIERDIRTQLTRSSPSYLLTAVVELPLRRVLDSVSLRLPRIAYRFKHFSRESRIDASDNLSNLFFIEGIWLASDSRGIDCTSSFQLGTYIYFFLESLSRIDHLDYVPRYKRLLPKIRPWNLKFILGRNRKNNRWWRWEEGERDRRSEQSYKPL